ILFIFSRCLGRERDAAIASGFATASIIQALATAFGLTALFVYSPRAFDIIKYCGATYLVYLGASSFLKGRIAGVMECVGGVRRPSFMKSYYEGLVTDLFNPQAVVVFLSVSPQFVDTNRGEPWEQMLVALEGAAFCAEPLDARLDKWPPLVGEFCRRWRAIRRHIVER